MENHDSKDSRVGEQRRRYEESETTVAAIFGGIAALLIAGVAGAFIYAQDTSRIQSGGAPLPPVASRLQAPFGPSTPQTTGSGSIGATAETKPAQE
jgi:hypothetical protein